MSKLTLTDKLRAVKENEFLYDLYCKELSARKIGYSKHGCSINGKKVSIQTYDNAQKYAAQTVYDEFYVTILPENQALQK